MKNLTSIAEHSEYLSASTYSDLEKWQLHRLRIKFGKQPLEIWQLVTCKLVDGVWVVLEDPKETSILLAKSGNQFKQMEIYQYQQAKKRCLFEGDFEIILLENTNNEYRIFKDNICIWTTIGSNNKVIEDLVKYNLQLTSTAQKQLG